MDVESWGDAARMPDLFTGMWMTFSGGSGSVGRHLGTAW
jgi:hypothetical protein